MDVFSLIPILQPDIQFKPKYLKSYTFFLLPVWKMCMDVCVGLNTPCLTESSNSTLMPLLDCTTFHILVSTLSLALVCWGSRRRGVPAMNLPMLDIRLSGAQTQLMTTCSADFWISASFTNTSPSATAKTILIPKTKSQQLDEKQNKNRSCATSQWRWTQVLQNKQKWKYKATAYQFVEGNDFQFYCTTFPKCSQMLVTIGCIQVVLHCFFA